MIEGRRRNTGAALRVEPACPTSATLAAGIPVRLGVTCLAGVLSVAVLGGCLRKFVPAPFGTPLDAVCDPRNGELTGATDRVDIAPAVVTVPRGWSVSERGPQEVQLTRPDAELSIWRGASEFVFPAVKPQNAVRCTFARGDTSVSIQAARLEGFNYRVDVRWLRPIDGQRFYMQLQTRYVEHLKQMRGIIEATRFEADSMRGGA